MLKPISSGRHPQQARVRWWFPARRLHLIDIENLAGDSRPSLSEVRHARALYADRLGFGAMDQVVVAASSREALKNAAFGWPCALYRVGYESDGADLVLFDVLPHKDVAARFTHVVIGSGNHLFAGEAKHLAAQGVCVTVVSWQCCLSRQLAEAADEVILLDAVPEAVFSRTDLLGLPGGDDVGEWAVDALLLGNLVRSVRHEFPEVGFLRTACVLEDGERLHPSVMELTKLLVSRDGISLPERSTGRI
jgi:hypothetical protein